MSKLTFTEAFAKFGAKLKNHQWSVSAVASDGSLVVSLWQHHFEKAENGKILYRDSFSRWSGPGNNEFRENIMTAFNKTQVLKAVISHTDETDTIQAGADASKVKKEISIKDDWTGRVLSITDQEYILEFQRI